VKKKEQAWRCLVCGRMYYAPDEPGFQIPHMVEFHPEHLDADLRAMAKRTPPGSPGKE
jgi:hypothetical protein